MLLQIGARVVAALTDALALVGIERAGLLDQVVLHGQIQQLTGPGDALAVEHVHHAGAERRRDLVLDDFDLGAVADGPA